MSRPQQPAPSKAELRTALSAARGAREPAALATARAAVCKQVLDHLASTLTREGTWVAAYEPLGAEPGSAQLLTALDGRGLRVLVPLTLGDGDLDWAQWTPAGRFAPLGPAAIALARIVLVPALAVAFDGTRLGRGGGSYDRALTRTAPGTSVVALLFDGELVPELPRASWDVPVDAVVMPAGCRWLSRNTEIGDSR